MKNVGLRQTLQTMNLHHNTRKKTHIYMCIYMYITLPKQDFRITTSWLLKKMFKVPALKFHSGNKLFVTLFSAATSEWSRLPRFSTSFPYWVAAICRSEDWDVFMPDGAQPHFLLGFREFLSNALPKQSMGQGEPASSSDWNPFYIYFIGGPNSTVYD
jgi:hypothetical protein